MARHKPEPGSRETRPRRVEAHLTREGGDLSFGRRNYAVFGAAVICIVLGFLLLHRGSITAAPILLVLGYCVLVPYGLATGRRSETPGE
jgi:Flp pilus assembly protein TadB